MDIKGGGMKYLALRSVRGLYIESKIASKKG
jgi:hypothetical protein